MRLTPRRHNVTSRSTVAAAESGVVEAAKGNRQESGDGFTTAPPPPLPDWFLPFYKREFGRLERGELYRCMAAAAEKGKISVLPQYEARARWRASMGASRGAWGDIACTAAQRRQSLSFGLIFSVLIINTSPPSRQFVARRVVSGRLVLVGDAAHSALQPRMTAQCSGFLARRLSPR